MGLLTLKRRQPLTINESSTMTVAPSRARGISHQQNHLRPPWRTASHQVPTSTAIYNSQPASKPEVHNSKHCAPLLKLRAQNHAMQALHTSQPVLDRSTIVVVGHVRSLFARASRGGTHNSSFTVQTGRLAYLPPTLTDCRNGTSQARYSGGTPVSRNRTHTAMPPCSRGNFLTVCHT